MQQTSIKSSSEEELLEYIHERDLDINYVFGYIMANLHEIKQGQYACELAEEKRNEN